MKLNDFPPHVRQRILSQIQNDHDRSQRSVALVEPSPCNEPLAESKPEATNKARHVVSILSIRKRLLDEDNLCEKFHVDQLRRLGLITNDDPASCRIITTQRKAAVGEAEHIIITVHETR